MNATVPQREIETGEALRRRLDAQNAASRRTAIVLASIAVMFFAGIILAQYSGSPTVGIVVLGFAILGFLVVAIGRNIRK